MKKRIYQYALALGLLFFSFPVLAGTYTGPNGIVFTDNQNTTGGGGVLRDVTFVANRSFIACASYENAPFGAVSVVNGSTYGFVDNFGATTSPSGTAIADGSWALYERVGGTCSTAPSVYEGEFLISNGNFHTIDSGVDTRTATRFVDLAITGTSSVQIDAGYFLELSELNSAIALYNPSHIRFSIANATSTAVSTVSEGILPWSPGYSTSTHVYTTLGDGDYEINITFGNLGTVLSGVTPFPNTSMYSTFSIAGGLLSATGTVEIYNGFDAIENPLQYIYQECSITNISGCINNAFIFLFVPDTASIEDSYQDMQVALSENLPFSYITDVYNTLSILGSSTAGTTSPNGAIQIWGAEAPMIGTTTLISDPIRNGAKSAMELGLWVLFGYAIWHSRHRIFP